MYLEVVPNLTPSVLNSITPKCAPQGVFGHAEGGHAMKDYHPSPDLLKRFVSSTPEAVDPADRRLVVRHLLRGCPSCQKVTRELLQDQGGRPREAREADTVRIVD